MNLLEGKRRAMVLPDRRDYDRHVGEMNPFIFDTFATMLVVRGILPVVWEPFAGTSASRNHDFVEKLGSMLLLSQDLTPRDSRVKRADSTVSGPTLVIGGMVVHPPYFGARLSKDREPGDVSLNDDMDSYLGAVRKAVELGAKSMVSGGMACVVGRSYRHRGKYVKLDELFHDLMESVGYRLEDVWSSVPDVALIMVKG